MYNNDGTKAREFSPQLPKGTRSFSLATGDLDGDGQSEIVIASGPGAKSRVNIFSHAGKFLSGFSPYESRFAGGVALAVGDVDGRGKADVIVAPATQSGQKIQRYSYTSSGESPEVNFRDSVQVYGQNTRFGFRVGTADTDGDGRAEVYVSPAANSSKSAIVQRIDYEISGPVLRGEVSRLEGKAFGRGVFLAGANIFGDAKQELVIADNSFDARYRVYSTVTGRLALREVSFMSLFVKKRTPTVRIALGDWNGDSTAEVVAAAVVDGRVEARVLQASTGRVLKKIRGIRAWSTTEVQVAVLPPAAPAPIPSSSDTSPTEAAVDKDVNMNTGAGTDVDTDVSSGVASGSSPDNSAHVNTNSNADVNTNTNAVVNTNGNLNTNANTNVNANVAVNANSNVNTNTNTNANTNTNSNANVNTNANSAPVIIPPATDSYAVQFIYFTPGRVSGTADVEKRITVLDRLANESTFNWIDAKQRQNYATELALLKNGRRGAAYYEPTDGTAYAGVAGGDALAQQKSKVEGMMQRIGDFYHYHTGKYLHFKPLITHVGKESAMHYWLPRIWSSRNVDQNPIVNTMLGETRAAGEIPQDTYHSKTIYVLLMDGGGGWAGSWQYDDFGGLSAMGDFATRCLDTPGLPAQQTNAMRQRWPGHFVNSWVQCNYNWAIGATIHEMGHALGLPHPADFACAPLSGALIMQTHWNTDLTATGFFKPIASKDPRNAGIMKVYSVDQCGPGNGKGFDVGIGTPGRRDGKFHTELEILLDNPQLHDAP